MWVSAGECQRYWIHPHNLAPNPARVISSFGLSIVDAESWNSSSSACVKTVHVLYLFIYLFPFYVRWYFSSVHVCVCLCEGVRSWSYRQLWAGIWTSVLWKNSQCPQPLSYLFRPQFILLTAEHDTTLVWFGWVWFSDRTL